MRISNKPISRIYIEQYERDQSYNMSDSHLHPYCELFYLHRGECTFFVNNHFYELSAGSIVLIPPDTLHSTRYKGKKKALRSALFFTMDDLQFPNPEIAKDIQSRMTRAYVLEIPEMYRAHVENLLENMMAEDRYNNPVTSPVMLQLCLLQLMIIINRFSTGIENIAESIHTSNRQLILAATFISRNYNRAITLEDIANASGFSPNYLSRKFHDSTGIGVHEYLNLTRLQKASVELLNTDHTITEVALNSGFNDSNYFKDAFKRMYGLSPRAYRKVQRNAPAEKMEKS